MSVRIRRHIIRVADAPRDIEQQPWRCAKCNVPVRKGMNDPCDCTRAAVAACVDNKEAAIGGEEN